MNHCSGAKPAASSSAASTWTIAVPAFVDEMVANAGSPTDHTSRMRLAIALARENVAHGGSPFGAVVCTGDRILAAGVNCVLSSGLSIAHAEIVALCRTQERLRRPNLPPAPPPLTLYTSAEPCCQCFGAVFWAGVTRLVCAATTSDTESIGFDEGPKPERWTEELERRGIEVTLELCRDQAVAVLEEYAHRGGPIYGLATPHSEGPAG